MVFITFGRVTDVAAAFAAEGQDLLTDGRDLGRQVAFIGRSTPAFRLNSPGWLDVAAKLAASLKDRAMVRHLCQEGVERLVPVFAASARELVAGYFKDLEALSGPIPSAHEMARSVSHISDRFFSGLLPLPNAHVAIVNEAAQATRIEETVPIVRFDLVFWDGVRLTALKVGGTETMTSSQRAALEALQSALGEGIDIRLNCGLETGSVKDGIPAEIQEANRMVRGTVFGPYQPIGLPDEILSGNSN